MNLPCGFHEKSSECGMDKSKISIALCTYNGESFLAEQLKSISEQTLLPDEIVVCDDGSTDNTLAIIEEFAKKVAFEIKIFRNKQPLRVTKNFEKAIAHTTGDIIFLCDQDDVWLPSKMEELSQYLADNQAIELVFSDAELVSETLQPLHKTQWQVVRFDETQKTLWRNGKAVEVMLGGNRVTGCTVAFRKSLFNVASPFPTEIPEVIHDTWLAWVATVRQTIGFYDKVLTHYRQHENQQIGSRQRPQPKPVGWKERLKRPRAEKLAPLLVEWKKNDTLIKSLSAITNPSSAITLNRKLNFLFKRSHLPENRFARTKDTTILLLSGDYHLYKDQEADWKAPFFAFLGDLLE